ncbi:MAG TPA: hypothetical protein VFU75_00840 [Gemmatimonadales bacterium]|nr:hypothetical protein [Gemmatimonadales bacterium]
MSWIVAGLIGGVVAWIADYVLWSKVFTKGMENLALELSPEEMKKFMGPAMAKSAVLALLFGVLFAYLYQRFRSDLWVTGGGILAGMEFATVLWLPTIALQTVGSGVWYVKARGLLSATFWAWLIRMNVVGVVVALLLK